MSPKFELEIKQLNREIRILQKKLERSEIDRARLEATNRSKEFLLKRVIGDLQEYQSILEKKSADLEQAFDELTRMKDKLVETEKMAALGSLVAGVAHEISTPVGTSVTLASTLMDETRSLMMTVKTGQLKRSTLNNYLDIAQESTNLILNNLNRAGELVQSFKQVAVDQSSLEQRTFSVKHYLEEVVMSLSPQFRKNLHTVTIEGNDAIAIHSYPGALAQVVTNLMTNSLIHGYSQQAKGHLRFDVTKHNDQVVIQYRDDGTGIPTQILEKIFEPFFTTAREKGGTGLGLHITYNLVTQKLQGRIAVQSEVGKGTLFIIELPTSVT
ncbi:ATP-binding protein [Gloeocapsopsis sp. IPPAS B-1203]|uniref:sensor histidine kinase n=1 Tax=Gloeocapsopsis sp. IPPAS B-1203 TaxID=2049454 RepID=UPI000C190217|nr:ATP-binding protein [Gloeocapsopsis sp. IPPAS B-1203]PIG91196.1 two-component sensor histidine kinase [Gloeocapsopsis sp. IPPAS B-1203]